MRTIAENTVSLHNEASEAIPRPRRAVYSDLELITVAPPKMINGLYKREDWRTENLQVGEKSKKSKDELVKNFKNAGDHITSAFETVNNKQENQPEN
jgi:hypothetical protein